MKEYDLFYPIGFFMLDLSAPSLSSAIRQTLVYADIFDSPLTIAEIHRSLVGRQASLEEVQHALDADDQLVNAGVYFVLPGREALVALRGEREALSRTLLPWAIQYGRVLGFLPFIRMVALTGSLAVMNVSRDADFDYMLVTAPGRLWTARAFALLLNRLVKRRGHTLCPNLIVSENKLAWPKHDLYSAHELCQMIPIAGLQAYRNLMKANQWINDFLPNAGIELRGSSYSKERRPIVQRVFELPLRGKPGDIFEQWEMNRKIARFSKQDGYGEETLFNAEICQGNFDHHSERTRTEFQNRLTALPASETGRMTEPPAQTAVGAAEV